KSLFRLCDVIIINEPELSAYSGSALGDANLGEIAAAAKNLLSHDDQTVIVTRGERGALAIRCGAELVVEAHAATAADTTGAGDCFCGTLVAALAKGEALGAAIDRANAAAALAVSRSGAADALPTSTEVEAFMATTLGGKPTLIHKQLIN
ncbi:MAG: bifunctional hydroxymethylpyrimidine kinase/phosphomethylpyrimidine kinase, partial [Sphingomonadaceae bacterium]|nr:bifunctional hydroxymethylpyrimidine kinase/phosphomethylpyrimidine kinase [Sphingomonadaceae bacterium]